ncbi:MAG: chromosomal replication initiator protein DnaA [alpha proteobacterium MED-G10]|nr:MAG: chromosomal replication initiator protein DnaA [alpha proteobacterium MED-G10]|tara:strand:+ start:702 stop:2075 length:1374 start_codon:yes stop_codon:yes gene_type:complete
MTKNTTNLSEIQAQWVTVRGKIRQKIGDAQFTSWIKMLTLEDYEDHKVTLSVPSSFIRTRIIEQYLDIIKSYWYVQNLKINDIKIIVTTKNQVVDNKTKINEENNTKNKGQNDVFKSISSDLDNRFTFSNFIVGKPNELAFAAARRVAESEDVPFNPLFLYGGVGLGKTHLMHSIAHEIKKRNPLRRVIYMSAEKFMYHFIKALRFKNTVAFKEQFRNVDVLMIDDVQFISGKESTQEEFFHTFNALIDQRKQLIISADKSPQDLEGIEERMRSRLGWGLVADIHPLTYELRLGILQAKEEKLSTRISATILEFLAHKITSNVRELEGALNRLSAFSSLVGRDINLDMVQDLLKDLLKSSQKKVNIEEIQKKVSQHFNVKVSDMSSARRSRTVARPRQVAMYLSKNLTSRSLPEIGRRFGNRDHTTVIHAVRKVEELMNKDAGFDEDVQLLIRMLES